MPLIKPLLFHFNVDSVGTNLCAVFVPLEKLETQSTKLKILKATGIQRSIGTRCVSRDSFMNQKFVFIQGRKQEKLT